MSKVSTEKHQNMIALAAYYRAEQRGFLEGDPVADWLEAEAEIEQLIQTGAEPEMSMKQTSDKGQRISKAS